MSKVPLNITTLCFRPCVQVSFDIHDYHMLPFINGCISDSFLTVTSMVNKLPSHRGRSSDSRKSRRSHTRPHAYQFNLRTIFSLSCEVVLPACLPLRRFPSSDDLICNAVYFEFLHQPLPRFFPIVRQILEFDHCVIWIV